MKLKIVSDGTKQNTRVVCAETGEQIEGVQLLSWSFDAMQDSAEACLHLWAAACDILVGTVTIVADESNSTFPVDDPERVIDISELIKKNEYRTTDS